MAIDAAHARQTNTTDASEGSVALLPEPFKVNAEAVDLAAAAARAALRRTSAAIHRFARPVPTGHSTPPQDPFHAALEPAKLP